MATHDSADPAPSNAIEQFDDLPEANWQQGSGTLSLLIWLSRLSHGEPGNSFCDSDIQMLANYPPVFGRYQIEALLGTGGYGAVFRALDIRLRRRVALKLAWPGVLLDPVASRRFIEEPKTVAALQHPGIIEVYDAGDVEMVCFIALELIEGPTLGEWLKNLDDVPCRTAARVIYDISQAIHCAHLHGIVHRDLKPTNILLRPTKSASDFAFEPMVTDFGSARGPRPLDSSMLTRTYAVVGTDHYMSPEQAAGTVQDVGPSSDIFSLGVILYEMLVGRRPFDGETSELIRDRVQYADPTPIRPWRKDVPRDLETIVLKCLEKLPVDRYATAQALADDLERFLTNLPIQARRPSLLRRGAKYCQRKPLAVTFMLSAVLGTMVLAGILAAWATDRISTGKQIAAFEATTTAAKQSERQLHYAGNIQHAAEALRRGSRGDALTLLDECRTSESAGRADFGVEWKLLSAEASSADEDWNAHQGGVCSVRFSPDGKLLISGGKDGRVIGWDTRTCQKQWEFKASDDEVQHVEISEDGELIAVGHEHGRIIVLRTDTRSVIYDQVTDVGRLFAMTWLGGRQELAIGGQGNLLTVLNPANGRTRQSEPLSRDERAGPSGKLIDTDEIIALSYVPELAAIVVGTKPNVTYLLSPSSLEVLDSWAQLSGQANAVCSIPIGPGFSAYSTSEFRIRLRSREGGDEPSITELPTTGNISRAMRFSDAGSMLVAGYRDGRVETWDVSDLANKIWRRGRLLSAHDGRVLTIDVSADASMLASGGIDGRINVWRGKSLQKPFDMTLQGPPKCIKFSPCGKYLAVTDLLPKGIKTTLLDSTSGEVMWQDRKPFSGAYAEWYSSMAVWPVAFAPTSDELVVTDGDGVVRGREMGTGKVIRTYVTHSTEPVPTLGFSATGNLLQIDRYEAGIFILDRSSTDIVESFDQRWAWCFDRRGTKPKDLWVGIDASRRIQLRGSLHEPPQLTLTGPIEKTRIAAVSRDGRYLAVAGDEKIIYFWDLERPEAPGKFIGHEGDILGLMFSPDGNTIISHAMDHTVRFWHPPTRAELLKLGTPDEPILAMDLNPAGDLLVLGVQSDDRYGLRFHRLNKASEAATGLTLTPKGAERH